jgi:hypothetical protein
MRASSVILFVSAVNAFACGSDEPPGSGAVAGGGMAASSGGSPGNGGTFAGATSGHGGSGGTGFSSGGSSPGAAGDSSAGGSLPTGGTSAGSTSAAGGSSSLAGAAPVASGGASGAAGGLAGVGGLGGSTGEAGKSGSPSDAGAGNGSGGAGQAGAGGAQTFPALRITSDTNSIEYTPALIAAEDFYPGTATVGSGGIVTLLSDPNVDLGTNAETQTLRQSVMYPNLRIIFTVTETFYRIVAKRSAGINALSDLAGKRIASINNTSAAYFVSKYLGTVGVTNYTIVSGGICMATPCATNTLPSLVERGQADAIALWEPSTEIAAQALGEDAIIFQDRTLYREIVNLHTTTEKLADPEKRRAIVEFVRALIKAQELFRTNPAAVYPRIVEAIGIQQPILEAVWHDERYGGELVPDILDVLEEEEPWVAAQTNRTPRTREQLTNLVDDSVAREALGLP